MKGEKRERLGILVSGVPDCEEGKLLGVPIIAGSTGEEQAKATFSIAQEWDLLDNVRALVFDTTASNSGRKIGACVRLENLLERKLLMLACRHHVYERILSAVHKELFGPSSGPDNMDYIKFRDSVWSNIKTDANHKTLQFKDRCLKSRMQSSIQALQRILSIPEYLPRDDYRECAELMLILLGETPPRGKRWLKPGAVHQAGWMPSVLYPAKMYSFSTQAGYDKEMIDKLEALCKFNALFYVPKWLASSVGSDAPYNDLELWHDLQEYQKYDSRVATAALAALERHFWYLTEELVVFSLFSNRLDDAKKQKIAQELLKK